MCTLQEIQEAIREDYKSRYDMDSTDIDCVMQKLPFVREPFTNARLQMQKTFAEADRKIHTSQKPSA